MSDDDPAAEISMVLRFSPPMALSEARSAALASTSCAEAVPTDRPTSVTRTNTVRAIHFPLTDAPLHAEVARKYSLGRPDSRCWIVDIHSARAIIAQPRASWWRRTTFMHVKLTALIGTVGSLVVASSAIAATCESLRSVAIPNVSVTTAELVTPAPPATGRGGPQAGGAPAAGAPAQAAPGAPRGGGAPAQAARGGGAPGGAQAPLPEYCRVVLVLKPSPDSNINSELWLPTTTWNGRFMAVGNGGFG